MKDLIKKYLNENPEVVLNKSLKDCHVKGLNSIMLHDVEGERVRLYYTKEHHELGNLIENTHLAVHPHHCDLKLVCLVGNFMNSNWKIIKGDVHPTVTKWNIWRYKSKISSGDIMFEKIGQTHLESARSYYLTVGDEIKLKAKTLHRVWVAKGTVSAWLVFEGKEDKKYEPLCYTTLNNNSPIEIDYSDYYQKFSSLQEILNELTQLGLYDN